MGMDVVGRKATSEKGEYFRNNVWWWRPLWDYCQTVAPTLTRKVKHAQTNDGDGLRTAKDCELLADKLQAEIDSGRCAAYGQTRDIYLANLPDDICDICGGTGRRKNPPEVGPGLIPCNGCMEDGAAFATGKRRPWETHYPFSVDNVQEFVHFLRACGGFRIW